MAERKPANVLEENWYLRPIQEPKGKDNAESAPRPQAHRTKESISQFGMFLPKIKQKTPRHGEGFWSLQTILKLKFYGYSRYFTLMEYTLPVVNLAKS